MTVNGARRPLPPDVDQAAYRIVQEALTNVSRHAGHACASVHLNYVPDALTVQVNDDGTGVSTMSAGPGLGLVGMRERVSALGGWLHAGPREGGGFQVWSNCPFGHRAVIRVLLADDQALIRSGIRSLLEAEDDIEVVAEAPDGQQAVALAVEHRPDIALIDIQMPAVDGIEATEQIVADERLDSVRVVILRPTSGPNENIFRALRAGASGFLLKDTEPADLLQALRVVMRGDALLSPAVTRRLIGEFIARPPERGRRGGHGNPHQEGTGGRGPGRARPVQRRDRRRHDPQPLNRQDPRQPGDDQARRA